MPADEPRRWKAQLSPAQRSLLIEVLNSRQPGSISLVDAIETGVTREQAGILVSAVGEELAQNGFVDSIRMNERGLALERLLTSLTI